MNEPQASFEVSPANTKPMSAPPLEPAREPLQDEPNLTQPVNADDAPANGGLPPGPDSGSTIAGEMIFAGTLYNVTISGTIGAPV